MPEPDASEEKTQQDLSNLHKNFANQPVVKLINLDLSFARVGSVMMAAKFLLNLLIPREVVKNPKESSIVKTADDLFKKIRQITQYSIHAQPGLSLRKPDDIYSDAIHNLEAASLGKLVYNLNAFIAPWFSVAKIFFPYLERPVLGMPTRMMHFADNAIGKITNMFWTVRRISMALVPYDGGLPSEALINKQNEVREFIGYYLHGYILDPIKNILNTAFVNKVKAFAPNESTKEAMAKTEERITQLTFNSLKSYWNNFKALISKKYECPHGLGSVHKQVGSEEPDNNHWYVRSKIASKVLGLPAGLFGTLLNTGSIGLNFVGHLLNNDGINKFSEKLANYANGLMAMVYMTGEVPANINEYFKQIKQGKNADYRHLIAAGIGTIGMVNRLKSLFSFGHLFQAIGLKPILDKFHNSFEQCFLGFFSYNRLIAHDQERQEAASSSSADAIVDTQKVDTLWKHIILPFRVIFKDPEVTYL